MYGCVSYKGAIVKSWELIIPKGEAVEYTKYKGGAKIAKQKSSLPVIYEDQNLIIVNKSCGLRFLSKVSYKGQTVSSIVKSYLKRKYGNRENAFAIYKVDDLESGLCILARDKRTANILSLAWESEVEKKYLGIVENPLIESKKSFRNYELQRTHQKNEQSESRTISLHYELKDIMHSRNQNADIKRLVKGLMIESYIEDGAQSPHEHVFGKSITDPCLGWEKTERLILDIADKL